MRIAFTSGPGAGKTGTLAVLRKRGYTTVDEAFQTLFKTMGHDVIKELNEKPVQFQERIARFQLILEGACVSDLAFLDRSCIDTLVYSKYYNSLLPDDVEKMCLQNISAYSKVFLFELPPKHMIEKCEYRPHTYEQSVEIEKLMEAYAVKCGKTIVHVPFFDCKDWAEKKTEFVLKRL
jgi:predicted ATPase